jgi:hypothetical protein
MTRITCRTPSTGKPIRFSLNDVGTQFTTIAEAPDFSVPDTSNKYPVRDPLDSTRGIRPGEIFFLTPLSVKNKDTVTRWVEVQLLQEDGVTIEFAKILIPKGDTAFVPLQGRSIFKRDANAANGDRIQVRAEVDNMLDVWASGEERPSNEHSGVV